MNVPQYFSYLIISAYLFVVIRQVLTPLFFILLLVFQWNKFNGLYQKHK